MNRGFLVATLFGLAFYGRVLGGCLSDDDVTPGPGVDGSVSLDASARPDALVPSEGGVDATTDGGAVPDASSDAPADALDASVDACVPGLVAWWPAEGTAEDTKGANEGTLIGDAGDAGFTTGKVGVAFSFDGTDRYVQVNAQSSLDMSAGDFTVDVWFKLASLATDQTIFQKLSGSTTADPSYFIEFSSPNALRFAVLETVSNRNDLSVTTTLAAGTWYHFAAVRSQNSSTIYLDGVAIGSQDAGAAVNTGTGGGARIGRAAHDSGIVRPVNGAVDELAIYNRALSAAEIQAVFAAGAARCK
ncbi:MAG: LamG domain-containing protein [Myxococcales bacterium]|nr:LamG domain-containing protein [Myxococcales bacterium]